jgi:hypothetical protein
MQELKKRTVYHKSVEVLASAHDTYVIGRTRAIQETFLKLEKAAQEMGLTVNERKTKYMEITFEQNSMQYLVMKNYTF